MSAVAMVGDTASAWQPVAGDRERTAEAWREVVAVGLLFQPRRRQPPAPTPDAGAGDPPADRLAVFRLALEASIVGDTSRFGDYFTEDLTFTSPHLAMSSRDSALRSPTTSPS